MSHYLIRRFYYQGDIQQVAKISEQFLSDAEALGRRYNCNLQPADSAGSIQKLFLKFLQPAVNREEINENCFF